MLLPTTKGYEAPAGSIFVLLYSVSKKIHFAIFSIFSILISLLQWNLANGIVILVST